MTMHIGVTAEALCGAREGEHAGAGVLDALRHKELPPPCDYCPTCMREAITATAQAILFAETPERTSEFLAWVDAADLTETRASS